MTRWLKVLTLRETRFSVLRAGPTHAFPSVFLLFIPWPDLETLSALTQPLVCDSASLLTPLTHCSGNQPVRLTLRG